MLKAILVDDEAASREALGALLKLYHTDISISAECDTIASAVSAVKKHKPDLLFLDVEMGPENGFDIFKHFPSPEFKIIFTTAHRQYAVEAFRFAALDYLLKPIHSGLLKEAIRKAFDVADIKKLSLKVDSFLHNLNSPPRGPKKIILKTSDTIYLVDTTDIVYCEADRGYTTFFLSDNSRIVVSNTIGDYEDLFHDYNFLRIHQSYLLNLHYFKRYDKTDGGMAILKSGASLPVATRKKDQLLQKLAEL